MSRRFLTRAGGALTVLGGLLLATIAVQNVIMDLSTTTGAVSSVSDEFVAFSMLRTIAWFMIPLPILVGLLGLFVLLGASPLANWGVTLAGAAMLLVLVQPVIPYWSLIGERDPSPSVGAIEAMLFISAALSVLTSTILAAGLVLLYLAARRGGRLGPWRPVLPAIGFVMIFSGAAPFALSSLGLSGGLALSEVSTFVVGVLWVALGVTMWRYAAQPEDHNTGVAPLIP